MKSSKKEISKEKKNEKVKKVEKKDELVKKDNKKEKNEKNAKIKKDPFFKNVINFFPSFYIFISRTSYKIIVIFNTNIWNTIIMSI